MWHSINHIYKTLKATDTQNMIYKQCSADRWASQYFFTTADQRFVSKEDTTEPCCFPPENRPLYKTHIQKSASQIIISM